MLKAIWILFKANAKLQLKSPGIFVLNMLTPIAYPILFVLQILIAYHTYDILTADLDLILTRPINLFFYKYFRRLDLMSVVMTFFSYGAFVTSALYNGLNVFFIFDLIRSKDTVIFWSVTIGWTIFAMLGNHTLWKVGLRKYESIG